MGKLILPIIGLSIKHNLSHAWFLGPHTMGKLILHIILLSVKQNLGHAWFFGPYTLVKVILFFLFPILGMSTNTKTEKLTKHT